MGLPSPRQSSSTSSMVVAGRSSLTTAERLYWPRWRSSSSVAGPEVVAPHWHPLRSVTRQRPGQPKAVSGGCAGSTGFQWPGDAAEVFRLKGSGIRDKPGGTVEKLEERLSPGFPQLISPCRSHND